MIWIESEVFPIAFWLILALELQTHLMQCYVLFIYTFFLFSYFLWISEFSLYENLHF